MSLVAHHLNAAVLQGLSIRGRHLICHVVVLETVHSGLVLIDTGLGTADYASLTARLGGQFGYCYARPRINPGFAVVNQLQAVGFQPTDVRHIVLTHLDLDHVGGLADFPHATVHVSAMELAAATQRSTVRARGRYRPQMWAHGPNWHTYDDAGQSWFGFAAVRDLAGLPEEIVMVPLPGHTPGHNGVAFRTDDGWHLAAGDAFFDPREISRPERQCAPTVRLFERLVTTDLVQRNRNQDRLRALVRQHPEIDVFSSHDPSWQPHSFGMPSGLHQPRAPVSAPAEQ